MDSVLQSDNDWLLNIQRKLYQWSMEHPNEAFGDMWNWITDPRNLRVAFKRVASNTGRNTPGVDGMTISRIRKETGEEIFLATLRMQLREGSYIPKPVRRKWIPKPGKPNQLRGLGIPAIDDRVTQTAIKQMGLTEEECTILSNCDRRARYITKGVRRVRTGST